MGFVGMQGRYNHHTANHIAGQYRNDVALQSRSIVEGDRVNARFDQTSGRLN